MPTLQFILLGELAVDATYQRSIAGGDSQSLIRKIAQHWNWDLCQPLVVSRRDNGDMYVIDGQHRLEAARLRGDIAQLPCVVVAYSSTADEAASFVHLNQQRRPLSKLDIFKAAVASEDGEACAIMEALAYAGLSIAAHSNFTAWKPGQISNISGIETSWRRHGQETTTTALRALRLGFEGQVLRYAGTIFPGIAGVCADEARRGAFGPLRFERFVAMLSKREQVQWRSDIMRAKADNPLFKFGAASLKVILDAWAEASGDPPKSVPSSAPTPPPTPAVAPFTGSRWCDQCDMKVSHVEAAGCRSRFCSLKVRA